MDKRGGNVSWDAFEEKAKLAFVADVARSRLVIKTRVGGAGGKHKQNLQVVARVAHQPRDVVKYQTSEPAHVPRLTRLLRFAMQEVLGPMRAAATTVTTVTTVSAGVAPVATAPLPASQDTKAKKKKKSKKKH